MNSNTSMNVRTACVCCCTLAFALLALASACTPSSGGSNSAPQADAGPDTTVDGGETVMLDGSDSSDPDGDSLSFDWSQTAGSPVTLSGSNTATPSFRAPNTSGSVRLSLVVTDPSGATSSDTVTINILAADNVPPVADAGDDRTVRGNEVVVLDGSETVDPDGDPLTFEWVQTDGVSVTLDDADTATPTFTAPNEDGELVFEMTVDDGQGHAEADTVTITVDREAAILFVANLTGDSVLRFLEPDERSGNVTPDTVLSGAETLLDGVADVLVDRENSLIAVNRTTNSLNLYLASSLASGSTAPFFVVQGDATLLDQPTGIEFASGQDFVLVSNTGGNNDILVFEGPSNVIFDGDLAPIRVISSSALNTPAGIRLDADDRLYVANTGGRDVLVFDNASTAEGDVEPSRTVTSTAFTDPISLELDDSGHLYVVNSSASILVFESAATLDGSVEPDRTVTVSGATSISAVAVDNDGTGYALDFAKNAIYVIENIADRSGTITANRTISGAATGLSGPFGLYLLED